MHDRILMAHGGGGELTQILLNTHVLPHLANPVLDGLDDGARLPNTRDGIVVTTDSFVVDPVEFPGGDVGHLAVCGTLNDIAMMGARPIALTLGLILQEGVHVEVLERVMASVGATTREAGVPVVTGDTKVVERGAHASSVFINTTGIGVARDDVSLSLDRIQAGDRVLINGGIAEHGLTIMSARQDLGIASTLTTDAAYLGPLVHALLDALGDRVRFFRDPTRSGVAGVVADLVDHTGLSVELDESAIPITRAALHTAELLGLDPLTVANEGKFIVVVAADAVDEALTIMRSHPLGRLAAEIGRLKTDDYPLVELVTRGGGRRIVQRPYGEELPRIC